MSLIDSLLLEEPIPELSLAPQAVWIALRHDGSRGTGTASDPLNGSVTSTQPLEVSLAKVQNELVVVATVAGQGHGYALHDMVVIEGAEDPAFNGTFPIYEVTSSQFSYRLKSDPSGESGGSPQCRKLVYQLDEILAGLPEDCAIHLGAGVFETRGHGQGVKTLGWKFRGAGMGVTTLKLVGVALMSLLG